MDLPNLENYPVYILNVVPELSEGGDVQMPRQITTSEPMSYDFYIPNVEHHVPMLNEEGVVPIVSQNSDVKSIKKLSYKKTAPNEGVNNNRRFELVISHIPNTLVAFQFLDN